MGRRPDRVSAAGPRVAGKLLRTRAETGTIAGRTPVRHSPDRAFARHHRTPTAVDTARIRAHPLGAHQGMSRPGPTPRAARGPRAPHCVPSSAGRTPPIPHGREESLQEEPLHEPCRTAAGGRTRARRCALRGPGGPPRAPGSRPWAGRPSWGTRSRWMHLQAHPVLRLHGRGAAVLARRRPPRHARAGRCAGLLHPDPHARAVGHRRRRGAAPPQQRHGVAGAPARAVARTIRSRPPSARTGPLHRPEAAAPNPRLAGRGCTWW